MTDETPPLPFPGRAPPTRAVVRPEDRKALLWRLRVRRLELADDLALGLGLDEPLSPSTVERLADLLADRQAAEPGTRDAVER